MIYYSCQQRWKIKKTKHWQLTAVVLVEGVQQRLETIILEDLFQSAHNGVKLLILRRSIVVFEEDFFVCCQACL